MRNSWLMGRSVAALVVMLVGATGQASASDAGWAIVEEINFARTRPAQYAEEMQAGRLGAFDRRQDPRAFDEAVAFLYRQPPLPPLRPDARLAASARAHASAQGPQGQVGHGAGLNQRIQRQGLWAGLVAENISYGFDDPRDVVRQLIIDSGVAGRGHRKNIFSPSFQAAGADCGAHRVHGAMCVINFAGAEVAR